MKRSLWIKFGFFLAAVGVIVYALYPTLRLWTDSNMDEEERTILKAKKGPLLSLGLDLVGGMHLVLEADTSG
ncbi:protein translocase subunit SecD, partial [candidate division WOR-3 bacterium]|nr:protein translocase subunit SecD [candidate division WOR-3 bacterium]